MKIVNVDVSLILGPLHPPKRPWYLTEREFAVHGGFRGVQARAESLRAIAVVLIETVSQNMPRFRRNGSPYTRIVGFFVGNIHPADREAALAAIFEIDYATASTRRFMFQAPLMESVT